MFGILEYTRRETIGEKGVRFRSICNNHCFPVNTNVKSFTNRWAKVDPITHELMEILGVVGNYTTESDVLKRWCDILPCKYPSYHVINNAELPLENSIDVFTVDNPYTLDMDDAISIHTNDDGSVTLGVHITDVASFILENMNHFDREVIMEWIKKRGSSAYFADQSCPMFPSNLAHNSLSLIPHTNRKAISLWLTFGVNNILQSHKWSTSIVKNTHKLSYSEFSTVKPHEYDTLSSLSQSNDPHDMIAWTMTTYNKQFAKDFLFEKGVLRTKDTDTFAQYVFRNNDTQQTHCDMENVEYTHSTSPIRRFVDIYNQMVFHKHELFDFDMCELNSRNKTVATFHKQHAILELSHSTRNDPVIVKIINTMVDKVDIEFDGKRFRVPRYDTFYEGSFDGSCTVELWGIMKNGRSTLRLRDPYQTSVVSNTCIPDSICEIPVESDIELKKDTLEECMGYPLDAFQEGCLEVINKKYDLFGTAPTGSGKTTVAMMGILKAFHSGNRAIFSSPIKALSNEKYADMKKRLNGRVSLLTGDMKVRCAPSGGDGAPELLIMTAEILRNKLNVENDPDLLNVSTVVIDECHYINDSERGPVWEETLLLLPKHVQVIALSATLSAPEEFCKWMSTRRDTRCVQHHERHVPLYLGSMINSKFSEITNTSKIKEGSGVASDKYHWKHASKESDSPVQLVKQLIQNDMCPAIVFCMSRKRCVQMAECFTESLMVSKRPYKRAELSGFELTEYEAQTEDWNYEVLNHKRRFQILVKKYLGAWRAQLERIPEYDSFIEMLYKGIAYHHSGMIPVLREFVEVLFREKMIVAVFATESLGVGIDMPARTAVFTQLNKPTGAEYGLRNLYTHEFMQMAGRAGRRGKDVKGYVVYYPYPPGKGGISYAEFKTMVMGNPPKAESQLQITPEFVIRNYNKGFQHMHGSLLGYGIDKEIDAKTHMFDDKEKDRDIVLRVGELNQQMNGANTYGGNMFISLNKKQLKTVKTELKNLLTKLNMTLEDVLPLYDHYNNMECMSNYMYNEWNNVVCGLTRMRFIESEKLTVLGKTAAVMCDGMPLVRAYVVVSDMLHTLSMEEIIAWLGLFAWSVRDTEEDHSHNFTTGMVSLIHNTCQYTKNIYDIEIKNAFYKTSVIYEWVTTKNVESTIQYTGLAEFGNFVKTMLRISSFVEEIRTILLGLEKYELYNRFDNHEERIFYGIVSNASIYISSS
jgi:superfamily II RNA helicase